MGGRGAGFSECSSDNLFLFFASFGVGSDSAIPAESVRTLKRRIKTLARRARRKRSNPSLTSDRKRPRDLRQQFLEAGIRPDVVPDGTELQIAPVRSKGNLHQLT